MIITIIHSVITTTTTTRGNMLTIIVNIIIIDVLNGEMGSSYLNKSNYYYYSRHDPLEIIIKQLFFRIFRYISTHGCCGK